jgi:CRISPR-associated protein Csd1
MILQALARYYDILTNDPNITIAQPGYTTIGVSYALNISSNGNLLDIFPLYEQVQRGRKLVDVPRRLQVPEQVKRSSGISPNFLCDNNVYVLGISKKEGGDPEYANKRFNAFREFNLGLLKQVDSDAARAVIAFLDRHNPQNAHDHPVIAGQIEGLLQGGNLVFMYKGAFVHDDTVIRQVWDEYKLGKSAVIGQCLVSGEIAPIARLHPSLKRVRGAQPSGASLVSFNERAYESYNRTKDQGLNAPVSEKVVFAYSTALNFLLSTDNPNPPIFLGDTTVVYWADSDKEEYSAFFADIFGARYLETTSPEQVERRHAEERLKKVAFAVERGWALDTSDVLQGLDTSVRFYVLGLAPNASRLSVRFFITEPFGNIVARIMHHYDDLKIIKEYANQPDFIPLRTILRETISQKAANPQPLPLLAGAIMRSILTGSPYPAALFNAILNRVRADMDDPQNRISKVNYVRAAVIKAFLIRKYRRQDQNPFQEVLIMPLNEQSTIPAYVLGRLFAVLEKVQVEAVGSVNASIKDRYFTSACATPASVFPVLLRLSQHHIAKAEFGYASDHRIQKLLDLLDVEKEPFPSHLTLDEQGLFILGYYQQRAAFFTINKDQSTENVLITDQQE